MKSRRQLRGSESLGPPDQLLEHGGGVHFWLGLAFFGREPVQKLQMRGAFLCQPGLHRRRGRVGSQGHEFPYLGQGFIALGGTGWSTVRQGES